ncbi:MAG: CDP-alcohol phosphatidyltransferase family protein [Aigarchaeota archaeon]|nr:CDP-alcohol phosphatidyltransferase family protein [Candidatus Caldarchaeales archaeon]MDJ0272316.1 CDP-alcohol phosphatidyltransferase family protein [Candidatus Caldarchaeales archaeon]
MSISRRGRGFFEKSITPIVKLLAQLHVTPNMLTTAGLLLTATATLCYYLSQADPVYFLVSGALLAAGSFLDGLDGSLARLLGSQSNFGAFLDSFTDRISDSLIVLGFLLSGAVDAVLALGMLASSMLVSYARARAEGLGVSLKEVGVGERAVRLLAAIAATFTAYINPLTLFAAAIFITVVSMITVVQRFIATAAALRR